MRFFLRFALAFVAIITLMLSIFYTPDLSLEYLISKYTDEESHFVPIDGMNVHFKDEGKGCPIILLHGIGSSLHTWDIWANSLKKNYRVIRLDLPGFGLTGPHPKKDYSMNNFTDFLNKFLLKIKVDTCYMAGNSMGGAIAWNYSIKYTSVKKMALIDAVGYPIYKSNFFLIGLCRIPLINKGVKFYTPMFMTKLTLQTLYGNKNKIDNLLVNRYRDLLLRPGNRQAFIDAACEDWYSSNKNISKVNVPTFIQWGEEDYTIPVEHALKFKNDILNSKIKIYRNVGHMPMEEAGAATIADFQNFLIKN